MSKWTRRQRRFSNRLSSVSSAPSAEETTLQKTSLKNGDNSENGEAPRPFKDERGRFVKGNPGGPGRPRKSTQGEFHAATVGAIPVDHWEKVVSRALEDAQAGDKNARNWLSAYVVGRPPSIAMVDGVPVSLLERLISLLRASNRAPEIVFEDLITQLET